jgi:uncharacterized protein (TIGR03083 family)
MEQLAPASGISELVAEAQTHLVALVEALDEADWAEPSWCDGWTVADVIVHTAAHLHGQQRNRRLLEAARKQTHDKTIEWLASDPTTPRVPVRSFRRVDKLVQLGEILVHRHDISGALDLPDEASPIAVVQVLSFGTGRVGNVALTQMRRRARGLRLVATDVAWATGSGAEVRGSGIALVMATSGRPLALRSLSGPGLPTLSQRVGRHPERSRP